MFITASKVSVLGGVYGHVLTSNRPYVIHNFSCLANLQQTCRKPAHTVKQQVRSH